MNSDSRTPIAARAAIALGVVALASAVWLFRDQLHSRAQAFCGVACFLGVAAMCSNNLRNVRPRIVVVGLALQIVLILTLRSQYGFLVFDAIGDVVTRFLDFSQKGAEFVFGALAKEDKMTGAFGDNDQYVFAFRALPTILFVSSFFSVLYYLGVMQKVVGAMAWVMRRTMGTGGAETLSASANVFMGQTEAPLLVKPYIRRMSDSQLLALMVGGMATVAGGVMVAYIGLGANAVALLTTSVMAAPAGLYIAKILVPDVPRPTTPPTRGAKIELRPKKRKRSDKPTSVIDAAARGALDGLYLALNVAALLIAFIAFIALINACLAPLNTSLELILGRLFAPVAALIGVEGGDVFKVGELLGIKLVANEFLAFINLRDAQLSEHSLMLATFALTGFANFSSVGIQLGGIGALAPNKRSALAKLGMRALLGGFLATLINASIAGMLLR